jgi:hypothetical protein
LKKNGTPAVLHVGVFFGLDRYTHPDVVRPFEAMAKFFKSAGTFCQNLKDMVRAVFHYLENLLYKCKRNVFMEEVAHGVDEDYFRAAPSGGDRKRVRMERDFKTVPIVFHAHCLEAARKSFRVTVGASLADARAARHRVPGRFSPFDCRVTGHFIFPEVPFDLGFLFRKFDGKITE